MKHRMAYDRSKQLELAVLALGLAGLALIAWRFAAVARIFLYSRPWHSRSASTAPRGAARAPTATPET